MKRDTKFTFITETTVKDPDTGDDVSVEIWKDNSTGGVFGVDASFLDQIGEHYNPFTGTRQELPDPPNGELAWYEQKEYNNRYGQT
jgi:hypothetical protein